MAHDPLLAIFRQIVGRPLSTAEELAIRAELEKLAQNTVPGVPGSPASRPLQVSEAGLALVKQFEGCARRRADGRFAAYPDPGTGGDPWTIGWGATGPDVKRGTVWTQAQCDARLAADLARHGAEVARAIGQAPTTQGQFDALTSFHYNTGAIHRATLTRLQRRAITRVQWPNLPAGCVPAARCCPAWCGGAKRRRRCIGVKGNRRTTGLVIPADHRFHFPAPGSADGAQQRKPAGHAEFQCRGVVALPVGDQFDIEPAGHVLAQGH